MQIDHCETIYGKLVLRSALSPQPSALSPQPSALSPQPSVLCPQSFALSPLPLALCRPLRGRDAKGVALANITCLKPFPEPAQPLFGSAVRERVRDHVAT